MFTEEAFKRAKRSVVDDQVFLECPQCRGQGELYTSHRFDCSQCDGRGRLTIEKFKEKIEYGDKLRAKHGTRDEITREISHLTISELELVQAYVKQLIVQRT
jgi:DnaJ-class molecular chaperone